MSATSVSNSNLSNTRHRFLACNAGISENKTGPCPYVFHAEGNLLNNPTYYSATEEKSSLLRMRVAMGVNPWTLLGKEEAAAQAGNDRCSEEKPFITLCVHGDLADTYKEALQKGSKIAFTGLPLKNSYKNKNGVEMFEVLVNASSLYPLSCRATGGGTPRKTITAAKNRYTNREGAEVTQQLATLVAGTVKSIDPLRSVNGRDVQSFKMDIENSAAFFNAVVNGTYSEDVHYDKYRTLSVSVWGPRASKLGNVLRERMMVVVTGTVSSRQNERSEFINLSAQELSIMKWPPKPNGNSSESEAAAEPGGEPASTVYENTSGGMEYDGDGEMPF